MWCVPLFCLPVCSYMSDILAGVWGCGAFWDCELLAVARGCQEHGCGLRAPSNSTHNAQGGWASLLRVVLPPVLPCRLCAWAVQARTDPNVGNTSPEITPGDKVIKVSSSFGSDVWEALNFGQVGAGTWGACIDWAWG